MSDAARQTLRCPNCGAPLPPASLHDAVTCAFCGSVSAPEPAAAGQAAHPRAIQASPLGCPRCGSALFEAHAGAVALQGCGACGGIWLDNASAQRALAGFDEQVAQMAGNASSRAVRDAPREPPVCCPVCARILQRATVTRAAVTVDLCAEHGTWFDRYELGLVLDALQPRPAPPAEYHGKTPDFHEGANPELREFGSIVAHGVLGTVGLLAETWAVTSKD